MIKRLILACTALLLTTGMAMAQNAIPIVVVECENGKVNFLPQEATAGSYVDFGFESFLGYELDTLYINKVTGNVIEPIEWELFSWQVRFLMPECDRVEVTVKFKKKKYTVLIDDGIENGIVELDGENGIEFGTQVILKAIPDHDYLFNNLTVTNEETGKPVSTQVLNVVDNTHYFAFTMPISDVTVNASFKPVPYYNIEITNGENGTITSDLESARVGDTVTLTVNNDTGCILKELKVVAGYPIEGGGEAHAPSVLKDNDMWYQQQVIVPTKIDNHTYQFVLPEQFDNIITPNYMSSTSFKITSSFKQVRPAVIWCENENSLFFIYEEDPVEDYVGLYGDYKISGMWIGSMVSETGWSRPAWTQDNAIKSNVQKVVFDEGFADLRPTSCYQWFSELFNLSDIEGIENLNTSEVTNMNSMFYSCFSLTTLNLNSFDVSKVTNATSMFRACSDLTTIFCDQTWNIDVASSMFQGASSLVGAVAYDNDNTGGNMANPVTGYFTGSQAITVDAQGNGVVNAPVKEFPTHTVSFTAKPAILCTLASLNVTGNNSGDTIETTLNNDVYSFVMPGEPVTISAVFTTPESEVPAVLWCEDNTTLYFVNVNYEAVSDSTWDGHTITQAWSGDIVNNTGWVSPGWNSVNGKATRVVFDESFAELRPTSCYQWFSGLTSLSGIEGIENLNTSEVTNMNSMFYNCSSLTTLNLNSFDVSKVTNSSSMFRICGNLTTIYCDQTWNIETSIGMFQGSYKLVGAVAYDNLNTGGNMANPLTGYFTGSQAITVNAQGNGVVTAPVREYPRQTVSFTAIPATLCDLLSLNVTGDISCNTIETTLTDGVYSFVMPGEPVTITAVFTTIPEGDIPAVLWSDDNTTLYFVNVPYEAMSDGTWDGHTITQSWIGDIVSNTAWSVPGWISVKDQATRVVFDESFADLRPSSCFQWFCGLTSLSAIDGIENLNTSEVTNMNSMFYKCSSLTTLNLNGFDVSKVTNSSSMFRICGSLTTIYCDQTWNIDTSLGMFQAASNIVGAVAYDFDHVGAEMANPHTGYFTGKWSINIPADFEHGSVTCEQDMAYTNETVTLTVLPENGYELESLTVSTVDSGESSGTSKMSLKGISVDVTEGVNHTYTFVMPASKVKVMADFAPVLMGDVDNNGEVNITDVTVLIDYLLTGNASGINLTAADCNKDGYVSIGDVTTLIDYLLKSIAYRFGQY